MADLIVDEPEYQWSFVSSAESGQNTWANLVRLSRDVLAYNPDVVIFDTANDDGNTWQSASLEAFIRRIWAYNPSIKISAFNFMAVTDEDVNSSVDTPVNQTAIEDAEALYTAYGIRLYDYWGTIQDLVNNEARDLNEFMDDTVHPNETGHNEAYALMSPHLPFGGTSKPGTLPDRLYDDGTFENTPSIIDGADNDGETGSWSDAGDNGRQSSTIGDTISFNAVLCSSLGAYRADGTATTCEISVDGGAYYDFTLYINGRELNEGLGTHDITIRVKSGGTNVRIDELWAV